MGGKAHSAEGKFISSTRICSGLSIPCTSDLTKCLPIVENASKGISSISCLESSMLCLSLCTGICVERV